MFEYDTTRLHEIAAESLAMARKLTFWSDIATADPTSGTVRLVESGVHEVGKKLVEEAAEAWMAAEHESPERAAEELSQLIYHVQAMMLAVGVTPEQVGRYL